MIGYRKQRGAALVVGMIFMLVLTIITLGSARTTLLQERMVANVRDGDFAFQAAEEVLRQVERRLRVGAESGTTGGLQPEPWTDANLSLFDCAGGEQVFNGDPLSWLSSPDPVVSPVDSGETLNARYRIVRISNINAQRVACTPLDGLSRTGAQGDPPYFMIFAYAEGPGGRGNALLTSTYYYED